MAERRRFVFALIAGTLAASVAGACSSKTGGGSGTDCVAACQKGQSCPGATVGDCSTVCSGAETVAAASGCTAELDAVVSCINGAADPCGSACQPPGADISNCESHYCTQNQDPTGCGAF
jgi:hypothetical protein